MPGFVSSKKSEVGLQHIRVWPSLPKFNFITEWPKYFSFIILKVGIACCLLYHPFYSVVTTEWSNFFFSRKAIRRTEITKILCRQVVSSFCIPKEVVMSQKSATNATYKVTIGCWDTQSVWADWNKVKWTTAYPGNNGICDPVDLWSLAHGSASLLALSYLTSAV